MEIDMLRFWSEEVARPNYAVRLFRCEVIIVESGESMIHERMEFWSLFLISSGGIQKLYVRMGMSMASLDCGEIQ